MSHKSPIALRELLPWYVNGSLSPAERRAVDEWLASDPDAQDELATWQQVRDQVARQPTSAPPAAVRVRLIAHIRSQSAGYAPDLAWRPKWAWGLGVALLVALILWVAVRPGIAVEWSVVQGQAGMFRVYRAPVGSARFVQVGQLAAQPGIRTYTFQDAWLVPWQSYVYRIQTVGPAGAVSTSLAIAGRGSDALPYQMAILLTGLASGYVVMTFIGQWRSYGPHGTASYRTA